MKYNRIETATFIERPNRFIAHVLLDHKEEVVHVKNTGRCREILIEGTEVILEPSNNPKRKTKYSLIAGYKKDVLINIDSQVPNGVVYESILANKVKEIEEVTYLKREVVYGASRFDLYFEDKDKRGFIEVKGVTLIEEDVALFPDAPTTRGTKHVYEMIKAVEEGYAGYIFFLIQMKGVKYFTPHVNRDPEFATALKLAKEKGVVLLAYDCHVTPEEIIMGDEVEIRI